MLIFDIDAQKIARNDDFKPAGASVEYLTATFNFLSDEWTADGVAATAIFWAIVNGEAQTAYTVLIENGEAAVPWECLNYTNKFYLGVSVFGVVGDKRITTNIATVLIDKTGYSEGETPAEPSQDVYAQLVNDYESATGLLAQAAALVAEAQTEVETATEAAETAGEYAASATSAAQAAAVSSAEATASAAAAATSEESAATSATNAATSEANASASETNAAASATSAQASEANAATSETNAQASATSAASSAANAQASETNAATSATAAATSETNAAASEQNAAASATTAQTYATAAAESATAAATSATEAETAATTATTAAENAAELVTEASETLTELQSEISDLQAQIYASFPTDNASGDIVTFTDGADDIPVAELIANIEPVQESGTPTPNTPKAISGWTGCDLTHVVRNIFDNDKDETPWEAFDLVGDGQPSSIRYGRSFIGGYTYTIINNTSSSAFYRTPTTDLSNRGSTVTIAAGNSATVTVSNSNILWVFSLGWASGVDIAVNVGTDTTYETYNPTIKSISWQDEAGTVYGGSLNVTTGLLTVERIFGEHTLSEFYAESTGTNTTKYIISNFFGDDVTLKYYRATGSTDNTLCNVTEYGFHTNDANHFYLNQAGNVALWLDNGTDTSTNIQIVAYLATPITYQLTPTEVKTLLGNNTIFANCGEVNVNYRADVTRYIAKKLSE